MSLDCLHRHPARRSLSIFDWLSGDLANSATGSARFLFALRGADLGDSGLNQLLYDPVPLCRAAGNPRLASRNSLTLRLQPQHFARSAYTLYRRKKWPCLYGDDLGDGRTVRAGSGPLAAIRARTSPRPGPRRRVDHCGRADRPWHGHDRGRSPRSRWTSDRPEGPKCSRRRRC